MYKFFPIAASAVLAAVLSGQTMSPSVTADLRARFTKESDPVRRARLITPLGDAEFQEIKSEAAAGNYSEALELIKQYRDQVQLSLKALEAKEPDPEKHPSGFKQLQFSLRVCVRRVDEIIVGLAGDEQKPFLELRGELDQLDHHLIRELFPRQPSTESEPPKPKR